ncbi:Flavoprotein oxygenase [Mycena sanguinolenta]|uniref:Flavoprotein oxygenase n=1 Tax=Mycena sanguinolenta TaxID=230812 RepID=A0A8H6ZG12_9AGAR|nr:Flavoprotein oxygenase [Mycena sanguinolenta]
MLVHRVPGAVRRLLLARHRSQFHPESVFKLTDPPNLKWKYGDGVSTQWLDPEIPRKSFDFSCMSSKDTYKILTSAIIPRPIALVSSLAADGVPNLAPFSYFSMVGHNPPLLSVSFSLSQTRSKHTRENISATKEFTVNIVSEAFAEAANCTSAEADADADEFILSGLTTTPSTFVKPACVLESAVSLECQLYFLKDLSPPDSELVTTTLVLGLIKKAHVHESVLDADGATVDPAKLRAISRLGGLTYARMLEGFDIPRPSWKKARPAYEELVKARGLGTTSTKLSPEA